MIDTKLKVIHDTYNTHEIVHNCFCRSCRCVVGNTKELYSQDLKAMTDEELLENLSNIRYVNNMIVFKNIIKRIKKYEITYDILNKLHRILPGNAINFVDEEFAEKIKDVSLIFLPKLIPLKLKISGYCGEVEFNENNYKTYNIIRSAQYGSHYVYYIHSRKNNGMIYCNRITPSAATNLSNCVGDVLFYPANIPMGQKRGIVKFDLSTLNFSIPNKVEIRGDRIVVKRPQKVWIEEWAPSTIQIGEYEVRRMK